MDNLMKISACKDSDRQEVYRLICELEETAFNEEEFDAAFHYKMDSGADYLILAEAQAVVIGFLSLKIDYQLHHAGKVATVEELIVSAKYRGHGAGKSLIANAIRHAKENHCKTIELASSLIRERAHHFYVKNGFQKVSYKFMMEL